MPVAFILGVDWPECHQVGMLLGIKTVANEFIAYRRLGELSTDYWGGQKSKKL